MVPLSLVGGCVIHVSLGRDTLGYIFLFGQAGFPRVPYLPLRKGLRWGGLSLLSSKVCEEMLGWWLVQPRCKDESLV